ncbi:hypothetical protein Q1695_002736 [Nippostrongylus brasiliensis]|nr:hypothetical protein Q1695_002736 [Nippostrongylus brasiliensis]
MRPFLYSLHISALITNALGVELECFSCVSNADWSYYMDRIPGLKPLNDTDQLPVAPLACTFDPMRVYADNTATRCSGYCVKWASAKILDDGGLEINFLRGCFDNIMESGVAQPTESRCYQTPADFNHKPGVEYRNSCFCKGFMCNSGVTRLLGVSLTLLTASLLL